MKVTYLRLENVAGLMVGSNLSEIEIDFSKSMNKIVAITASNGRGKALPNSAKVITPDGYKLMGEIEVGDYVYGISGEKVKVEGVYPQGIMDIYEIHLENGRTAQCTNNHLWTGFLVPKAVNFPKEEGYTLQCNPLVTMTLAEIMVQEGYYDFYVPCLKDKDWSHEDRVWDEDDLEYSKINEIMNTGRVEEATCIYVDDPDHLFLIEQGIFTHNTVLLSTIHPFSGVGTLDDRSTLPFIIVGKNGYKEIRYTKGSDEYIIKHFYKANKESHIVKSYFMKNGEELNENGNVTSFNSLVETHFGLTMEMMRLIRIGSNVNSFISLLPARRKEYIGKLIEEIDLYIQIYKKINDDIKIVRAMMQANTTSLRNCHITDIEVERNNLSDLNKDIKGREKDRDDLIADLSRVNTLMQNNDIDKLRSQRNDAMSSLNEYKTVKDSIESKGLIDRNIDSLIEERNKLSEMKVSVQSNINSYRLSIDQLSAQIERLEGNAKKISSDNDMNSLVVAIEKLRETINRTPKIIKSFVVVETSESVYGMMLKLQSLNQVSKVIISFGEKPISIYKKLVDENKSVEKWLANQIKLKESSISKDDLMSLIRMVFAEDDIISPNCDVEFKECPYYRLYDAIKEADTKLTDEIYDSETLNHIKILSDNMALVFNAVDMIQTSNLPDKIKDDITYKSALKRLSEKLPFFDLSPMEEYLGIVKEAEIYKTNAVTLQEYEYRLMMYKKSGIDSILEEIKQHKEEIKTYNENIRTEMASIQCINNDLAKVDSYITLVGKFNDLKKYKKTFETTLESVTKLLEPLETAASEKRELEFKVTQMRSVVDSLRNQHRLLEAKINNYNRLVDEGTMLNKKHRDLTMILDAVSTKKGIPVYYMRKYLVRIQKLTNDLLDLIYGGEFQLAPFVVTPDEFQIPYTKNGKIIEDIKYSSQSEISMTAMALSFSLATNSSMEYNIILADEVDSGLDEANRLSFLKMLYKQMDVIHAEQVFIISHNLSQMTTIPMDCIVLSDTPVRSKLQNIIWEKP